MNSPRQNDRQIRSSLIQRVHSCIVGEPPVGHMQARAVIREVVTWLRERGGYPHDWVAQALDKEAGPTFSQED